MKKVNAVAVVYNGQTNTRVSAAFTIRGVTDMNNPHNLSFLGDAVFCTQHFNKTPADQSKFVYVGRLSEADIKITDDLTADKAYRIIKAAQAVLKEDSRYQDQLNVRQLVFGVQQVLHSSESLMERLRHGVANEDFTASQAKLFGEYYKAIYDKFHTSAYYNMPVSTKQSLTADISGGNTRSGDNYILATYTLNMSGVTAKVNSSSTSGVTASVSGKTLTISIPASKMPTSGSVSYSISLTAANQSVEFVNLYTSNVDGKQNVIMLEEEYYTATKTVSGSVPVGNNGSVTVIKVDATNTAKTLSGAYFIIADKDRGTTYILGPTDSNGTATKNLLPIGHYTITESVAPDGYARSTETYSFEVTAGGTNTFSYTFKDTPVNQEIKWTPKVYKMENYGNGGFYYLSLRNEDYTFELLQDDVVIQTAKISSTYDRLPHFDFEPVIFTEKDNGKTFHFTIREQNDGQPGVIYSSGYVNYTITIKDVSAINDADRWSITTEYVGVFTWSSYQVSPIFLNQIPTGSWTPTVFKEINSDTLRNETFTFALYENGEEIDRNTITGSGTLTFKTINYTADDIGTHTYTIREIAGTNNNIHYDTHEVTFVVDVSFDPNKLYELAESNGWSNGLREWGTLNSSQIAANAKLTVTQTSVTGSTTFTNILNKTGSWAPEVKKVVTGNGATLKSEQFTFALYDENGNLLQMAKNDASGKVTFEKINYTLDDIGTHTYTIEEWTDGQDGWIYDTHTLTYTVKVTEGTSSLTVTPTASGSTTFENKYETIKIRVEKEWNDNNNANGRRQAISFVLYGSNGNMIPFTLPVGQTSYEVTDVPKYNLDGKEITYTLSEVEMENYTSDVRVAENVDGYRFVFSVTNTELTDIIVTKVWNDQNQTALRKDVELTLMGSDGQTYTGTIPVGETTYTFKYLPVYKADGETKVEYTLSEAAIDGYSSRIVKDSTGYKFTVTNTPIVDLTEYTVHKKWVDNDNQDGIRPKEITVTIKGSDGKTYSATFGGTGDYWSYTFTELPKFWNNDQLIVYTVESENSVPGYTSSISGDTITNSHTPDKTTFMVHKKWVDNSDQDGVRPQNITVTIKGSDGSTHTATFSGTGDDWSYTFTDLDKFWNDGELIAYTVESENTVPGYSTSIDDDTIINAHEPEKTTFTVYKKWVDNNDQDGVRPSKITVTIKGSDGKTYTATFSSTGNDWSYTFTELPKYNDGVLITYTVESENAVPGYTPSIDGDTITNTHNPETTEVKVTKVWVDGNNQDGLRTDVYLRLVGSDGKTYLGVIPLGETTYTWTDLPVYMEGGQLIVYTLTEAAIPGYSSEIVKGSDGYSFTVINTHEPEKTTFTVYKKWVDNNDQDGVRPSEITVTIKGSDGKTYSATFSGASNDWPYTFENLPKHWNNGELITYSVESENAVPGYTAEIEGDTIKNTHEPEKTNVTTTKIWVDGNNQDGIRADVYLTLVGSDGKTYLGVIPLGETTYTWTDLPVYMEGGQLIIYTLTEAAIPGYSSEIVKGADGYSFVVTNTHEPEVTNVTATKIWEDNNDQDGLRTDVYLTLTGSDGSKRTGTIRKGETSFTWSDLPVYKNGELIVYTLIEAEIDGYESEIVKGADGYTFVVTNTHIPEVIEIPIRKIWKDRDNSLGVRPDNITVVLYGSDGSERMATIRAIDDWLYTFKNLPKYWNGGERIEYTLSELPVHGYTTEIVKGEDGYSFTISNTLVFGRLHIIKTAEDGFTEGLRFRIYGVSHQGTTVDVIAVTGADGVARVDYILPGSYYVEEIDIPDRYVAPDRQTVIVVGDDSDPEITVLSFYNELKRMSVIVNKTAEDGVLSGHKFRIEGTDYLGNIIKRFGLTDENGEFVFDDLLAGDYVITEIDTDIRYVVPEEQDVTVTWGQDETVSFHNSLKYWRLTVRKTDAATGEPVAGAVYGIYKDGVLIDEYITDENGAFTSIEYLCGEGYTLKEIAPAPGFTLDGTIYELQGTSAEDCITVLTELGMDVTDTPTHVTITKADITTGKPLPGAEITIFDADGNVVYSAVTDENGEIEAFYLPVGNYTFRETYSPDGFIINENTFIFEILEDGSILGDTEIEDEPYTVTLSKLESTSKAPVQGAIIEVYDKDGNLIGQFITDVNGEIFMRELIPGVYTYKEIYAPNGYVLDDTLHTFILNEDGSISGEITFENARIEPTAPKTGDHTLLVGGLALLSLVCIIFFICKRKRYDNDD